MVVNIEGYPDVASLIAPSDVTDFMLVEGSTALPYEAYGYKIPVTLTAGSAETTDIYIDEPLRKVGDEAEYIDYKTQKWHRVRKNLFDPSINIVKGSLTSRGEFVYYANSVVTDYIPISVGTYTFSMSELNYGYVCAYNSEKQHIAKAGNFETWLPIPFTFSVPEGGYIRFVLRYGDSAPLEPSDARNIMLNAGTEALPYEPYIEDTEVDITLPAISTLAGTNTLTVGTEVQPSKVYLKIKDGENVTFDPAITGAIACEAPFAFLSDGRDLTDYTVFGSSGGVGDPSKNLFNKADADVQALYPAKNTGQVMDGTSSYAYSLVIPVGPGTYTASIYHPLNTTARNRFRIACYSSYPTIGASSLSSVYEDEAVRDGGYVQMTFTAPAGSEYILLLLWAGSSYTSSIINDTIENNQIMIESGSSRTEYEPSYTGYRIPVSVKGKNYFDKSNADVQKIYPDNTTGQIIDGTSDEAYSLVVPIPPGSYKFFMYHPLGVLGRNRFRIACYSNYPTVGATAISSVYEDEAVREGDFVHISFTAPIGTKYAVIFLWSAYEYTPSLIEQIIANNYMTLTYEYSTFIPLNTVLLSGESISLFDTGVDIGTEDGVSIITVSTSVQPELIVCKGNIEFLSSRKTGNLHIVSYYSQDGQNLLGKEYVSHGQSAVGSIIAPTKTSTEQYDYSFSGWASTTGQTSATVGALDSITSDKSVYAAYSETARSS